MSYLFLSLNVGVLVSSQNVPKYLKYFWPIISPCNTRTCDTYRFLNEEHTLKYCLLRIFNIVLSPTLC